MAFYVKLSGNNGSDEASWSWKHIRVVCCSVLSAGFLIGSCVMLGELLPPSSSHAGSSGWVRLPFVEKANVIGLANIHGRVSRTAQLQPRFLPSWPYHGFFPGLRQARQRGESTLQQINLGQLRQHGSQPSAALALETIEAIENKMDGQVEVLHSEEDFDQRMLESSKPIMVEFTASWCGPCKVFAPIYEQIAADYTGKAQFLKVDARENDSTSKLAKRFQVKSIPAFYLIHEGKVVAKQSGVKSESDLRGNLEAHLLQ